MTLTFWAVPCDVSICMATLIRALPLPDTFDARAVILSRSICRPTVTVPFPVAFPAARGASVELDEFLTDAVPFATGTDVFVNGVEAFVAFDSGSDEFPCAVAFPGTDPLVFVDVFPAPAVALPSVPFAAVALAAPSIVSCFETVSFMAAKASWAIDSVGSCFVRFWSRLISCAIPRRASSAPALDDDDVALPATAGSASDSVIATAAMTTISGAQCDMAICFESMVHPSYRTAAIFRGVTQLNVRRHDVTLGRKRVTPRIRPRYACFALIRVPRVRFWYACGSAGYHVELSGV